MLFFNHTKGGRFFYAPDGAPTGSTGNPGANQGGAAPAAGATGAPADPFAGIDFDDLPPEIKTQLTKAKEQFATLQTNSQQTAQQLEVAKREASQFQSRHDRLQADLQRLQPNQQQQQATDPQAVLIGQIETLLIKKGIDPAAAKTQAPIHAELLALQNESLKREIGVGLQPVVGTVLQQQASAAYQAVQQQDRLGALAIPDVAQATWDNVQHMIANGQPVTPEVVANLKNMNFAAYLEANPTHQMQPPQQQPPVPQFTQMATRYTFPGAGNQPSAPVVRDANAPRTNLNEDTKAALAATFARMGGPKPTGLK